MHSCLKGRRQSYNVTRFWKTSIASACGISPTTVQDISKYRSSVSGSVPLAQCCIYQENNSAKIVSPTARCKPDFNVPQKPYLM